MNCHIRLLLSTILIVLIIVTISTLVRKNVINANTSEYLSRSGTVNVKDYGAKGDGIADDTQAISDALAYAMSNKATLYFPSGIYLYNGVLQMDSIAVKGDGETSILSAIDPVNSAIKLTGASPSLSGVLIKSPNLISRSKYNTSTGVLVMNAHNFIVENVIVENVAGGGIFVYNSSFGRITNNIIYNTLADGIHITNKSKNINVYGNKIYNSGDDQIAVVSYIGNGDLCSNIDIYNNQTDGQNIGRGITVVGGKNIKIRENDIRNTYSSGLYAYSEITPKFSTYQCEDIQFLNNTLTNIGSKSELMGGILIGGRNGYVIKNIEVKGNTLNNSEYRGIAVNKFVDGVTITDNVLDGVTGDIGIFAGSSNNLTIQRNTIKSVRGVGTYIMAENTGKLEISFNKYIDINTSNIPTNDVIYIGAGILANEVIIKDNHHYNPGGYVIHKLIQHSNPNIVCEGNTSQKN